MDNQQDICLFLIRAKRATYAGKGREEEPSRLKSHDLKYVEGEYTYYDTYLGGDSFAGEEAMWIKDNPYWAMNYVGRVIGSNFSGDFLKEALKEVPLDKPFRGPSFYEHDGYIYRCKIDGEFNWFRGHETIERDNQTIYECYFHGGLIK
jgi:hypothetical protein